MKRLNALLVLSILVLWTVARAASDENDFYHRRYYMPAGKHKDQLIDTSERRPVIILPPHIANIYGAKEGEKVIANFSYEDRHWVAKIPKSFAAIIPQKDNFPESKIPVPMAHTMFRVVTNPGDEVLLYPQIAPPRRSDELTHPVVVTDFNLTAEAVGIQGWKYGLLPSLLNEYAFVMRAVGSQKMAEEKVIRRDRRVEQFLAKFSPEVRDRYPHAFLELSNEWQLSKMYHLILRNCDTVQFCVLDRVMEQSGMRRALVDTMKFIDVYPAFMKQSLELRGVKVLPLPQWDKELNLRGGDCGVYAENMFDY